MDQRCTGSKWIYGTPTQSAAWTAAISESGANANITFKIRTHSLANKQRNQSPSQRMRAWLVIRTSPWISSGLFTVHMDHSVSSHVIKSCFVPLQGRRWRGVAHHMKSWIIRVRRGQYSEPVNTDAGQDTERDQMKLGGETPKFMTQLQWFELKYNNQRFSAAQ